MQANPSSSHNIQQSNTNIPQLLTSQSIEIPHQTNGVNQLALSQSAAVAKGHGLDMPSTGNYNDFSSTVSHRFNANQTPSMQRNNVMNIPTLPSSLHITSQLSSQLPISTHGLPTSAHHTTSMNGVQFPANSSSHTQPNSTMSYNAPQLPSSTLHFQSLSPATSGIRALPTLSATANHVTTPDVTTTLATRLSHQNQSGSLPQDSPVKRARADASVDSKAIVNLSPQSLLQLQSHHQLPPTSTTTTSLMAVNKRKRNDLPSSSPGETTNTTTNPTMLANQQPLATTHMAEETNPPAVPLHGLSTLASSPSNSTDGVIDVTTNHTTTTTTMTTDSILPETNFVKKQPFTMERHIMHQLSSHYPPAHSTHKPVAASQGTTSNTSTTTAATTTMTNTPPHTNVSIHAPIPSNGQTSTILPQLAIPAIMSTTSTVSGSTSTAAAQSTLLQQHGNITGNLSIPKTVTSLGSVFSAVQRASNTSSLLSTSLLGHPSRPILAANHSMSTLLSGTGHNGGGGGGGGGSGQHINTPNNPIQFPTTTTTPSLSSAATTLSGVGNNTTINPSLSSTLLQRQIQLHQQQQQQQQFLQPGSGNVLATQQSVLHMCDVSNSRGHDGQMGNSPGQSGQVVATHATTTTTTNAHTNMAPPGVIVNYSILQPGVSTTLRHNSTNVGTIPSHLSTTTSANIASNNTASYPIHNIVMPSNVTTTALHPRPQHHLQRQQQQQQQQQLQSTHHNTQQVSTSIPRLTTSFAQNPQAQQPSTGPVYMNNSANTNSNMVSNNVAMISSMHQQQQQQYHQQQQLGPVPVSAPQISQQQQQQHHSDQHQHQGELVPTGQPPAPTQRHQVLYTPEGQIVYSLNIHYPPGSVGFAQGLQTNQTRQQQALSPPIPGSGVRPAGESNLSIYPPGDPNRSRFLYPFLETLVIGTIDVTEEHPGEYSGAIRPLDDAEFVYVHGMTREQFHTRFSQDLHRNYLNRISYNNPHGFTLATLKKITTGGKSIKQILCSRWRNYSKDPDRAEWARLRTNDNDHPLPPTANLQEYRRETTVSDEVASNMTKYGLYSAGIRPINDDEFHFIYGMEKTEALLSSLPTIRNQSEFVRRMTAENCHGLTDDELSRVCKLDSQVSRNNKIIQYLKNRWCNRKPKYPAYAEWIANRLLDNDTPLPDEFMEFLHEKRKQSPLASIRQANEDDSNAHELVDPDKISLIFETPALLSAIRKYGKLSGGIRPLFDEELCFIYGLPRQFIPVSYTKKERFYHLTRLSSRNPHGVPESMIRQLKNDTPLRMFLRMRKFLLSRWNNMLNNNVCVDNIDPEIKAEWIKERLERNSLPIPDVFNYETTLGLIKESYGYELISDQIQEQQQYREDIMSGLYGLEDLKDEDSEDVADDGDDNDNTTTGKRNGAKKGGRNTATNTARTATPTTVTAATDDDDEEDDEEIITTGDDDGHTTSQAGDHTNTNTNHHHHHAMTTTTPTTSSPSVVSFTANQETSGSSRQTFRSLHSFESQLRLMKQSSPNALSFAPFTINHHHHHHPSTLGYQLTMDDNNESDE